MKPLDEKRSIVYTPFFARYNGVSEIVEVPFLVR